VADRSGNRAIWGLAMALTPMARPSAPLSFGDTASASLPGEVRHWIVKSGNDGHKVKEREWSLRGAIALRSPNGVASQ
jgi:hypothetical protein